MGVFDYKRRQTVEVDIAGTVIGSGHPIMVQSMTDTSTNDIEDSVQQIIDLTHAGAAVVRLTAQGNREVDSLREIKNKLKFLGISTPLVADIHFNTAAAFAAAEVVDKVRINPGNFVDPGRVFKKIEYSDEEYRTQLDELENKVRPFFELCRRNNVAVRIGVNHGSLSDRIMSRYGDSPEGMVESAMEFLRISGKVGFHNIVLSIKSSNTRVMVETVRLLVKAMDNEGMKYPLHLGVTEAGEGEDGRIKSAVGIGTLLGEGVGDTIRVSLSENPVNEIPVAKELVAYMSRRDIATPVGGSYHKDFDPLKPSRRLSSASGIVGGNNVPVVIVENGSFTDDTETSPDFTSTDGFLKFDTEDGLNTLKEKLRENVFDPILLTSSHQNRIGAIKSFIHAMTDSGIKNPVVVSLDYPPIIEKWQVTVRAAADFGSLLLDNLIDGVNISASQMSPEELAELSFGILQGAGSRITKTEYIACPGCGRTLFSLSPTLARVKEATKHLKGLKIGVMGCIVNGPGEMADADYGYVGAGKGRISLYRGKDAIERNIPEEEAVEKLIQLLKTDGRWIEP